jgi:hypothetical protein
LFEREKSLFIEKGGSPVATFQLFAKIRETCYQTTLPFVLSFLVKASSIQLVKESLS